MSETIRVTASDGHQMDACLAAPEGPPRGGLVIGQEMYGINDYIRSVCAHYAQLGYLTIAPALFDRMERNFVLPYDEAGNRRGKEITHGADHTLALVDLKAAADAVRHAGRVALLGYCYGGTLAWLAACRDGFDAAIAYYGSDMCDFPNETPRCPILCLVGEEDRTVSPDRIKAFLEHQSEVPFLTYPGAQHGFDNHLRPARHHTEAMAAARADALRFLRERIG